MKTYKQFISESNSTRENINEIAFTAAALGAAKLASMGLGAYSAYRAAQDRKKGNYKGAALNALGALPAGGTAFKGAQAIGAGRNLARGASTIQSIARHSAPARNQVYDAATNMGIDAVKSVTNGAPANAATKKSTEPAKTEPTVKTQPVVKTQPTVKPRVLSKLNGVQGTGVGKNFVAKKWSSAESDRYKRVAAANQKTGV